MPLTRLSIETQTLHAELMERLGAREAQRSVGSLEGTFTTKLIGGKEYLYFLHYTPGGRRNISLGPNTPRLAELVARHREGRSEEREDPVGIRELCAQLKAGKVARAPRAVVRVLRELADASLFRLGGVLVGTYAFGCIGNLLGVRWDETTLGTQDVDIAAARNISVAVPNLTADIPKTLESLSMGFFPIPPLNPRHPSTSFAIRKSPLRIDLLTPKTGREEDPVYIPRLRAAAQPLSFLDYLLEEPIPGAVLDGDAVQVFLPQPLRFALHKLVVSQLRDATAGAKAQKDLYQAYQLLAWFGEERPSEINASWEELTGRGGRWRKLAEAGKKKMEQRYGTIK
ncbi:MAG TPA: nucleotidyltransferase domain-containing protein [Syntrophales bacterium]|nr:nucleotidyltransferase domain-containing protein [Syntrophales bacterium]